MLSLYILSDHNKWHKVNLNQIAVLLPEGTNQVDFEYRPRLFLWLLYVQRAALGILAAGVVGMRLNWLRRDFLHDVAANDYRRLFARIGALNWHVEIYLEGAKLGVHQPVPSHSERCVLVQLVHSIAPLVAWSRRDDLDRDRR